MQPWRFEADDSEIRFYMVPERTTVDGRPTIAAATSGSAPRSSTPASPPRRSSAWGRSSSSRRARTRTHVATIDLGASTDAEPREPHPFRQYQGRQPTDGQA